ncbi:MAG: ABC transporter [Phycisphaerae bacterium]|nr:Ribose import permease protein RbsC [Phycisphaerales bacterium]MCK6475218.1 ABC transporter permease [Phycisphaerales bacterium]
MGRGFPRRLVPGRDVAAALCALVLMLVLGSVFNADGVFFDLATHADTWSQNAAMGILACGLTVVIITGGIDLSVGSVVALCAVGFSLMVMKHDPPLRGWVAIPAALGIGTMCGAVAGALVAWARVQPFVATLAVMAAARGLAKWVADGVKIQKFPYPELIERLNTKIPIAWGLRDALDPASGVVPTTAVSVHVVVFLIVAAVTILLLRTHTIGVKVYAIGDNEQAARYAGVPVRRVKLLAYMFAGLCSGIAGVLFCALERQGNPDGGVGYELTAIAMVVIGGTSLSGGRGGVVLTMLGVLTIGYLRKILDLNSVGTAQQLMITGGIIVVAVLVQGLRRGGRP